MQATASSGEKVFEENVDRDNFKTNAIDRSSFDSSQPLAPQRQLKKRAVILIEQHSVFGHSENGLNERKKHEKTNVYVNYYSTRSYNVYGIRRSFD